MEDTDEHQKYLQLGKDLYNRLDIEKELECPVCLIIPRSFPIFLCRAGHSVCFECFPRLPRNYRSRRCPICQAKYCNPPARNFIAEKLLDCLLRRCRFDFLGCEFISSSSETLVNHEQRCTFRPIDFKIIKKLNLHNLSRNTEMCIAEILQLLSQITISVLAILVVLFFLVSLFTVLMGSMMSFVKAVNICKMSSECQLNDPNFIELWNDDLNIRFTKILSSVNFISSIFSFLVDNLSTASKNLLANFTRHTIDVSNCHPTSKTSLYYDWPDTYLPSHLDNLIWKPNQDNVDAGNFTLNWDVDTNVYKKFSDQTDTRYGFTETSDPAVVRAFSQWKMDMVDMPEHCQIVAVEMWHGRRMLQEWDSPLLYASREILVMSTITGWDSEHCPENLKFGNITWVVKFNAEACRMVVDYIPEVNLEASFIY